MPVSGPRGVRLLDQFRTVDLERLVKVLGQFEDETVFAILERLQKMFAE